MDEKKRLQELLKKQIAMIEAKKKAKPAGI